LGGKTPALAHLTAMHTDERVRNRRSFRQPMFLIGIAMTVFYICLGGLLLLNKNFLPNISEQFRNIFAAMVLIYGTYRGWRFYADYFKQK
jgi:hypothetical protein